MSIPAGIKDDILAYYADMSLPVRDEEGPRRLGCRAERPRYPAGNAREPVAGPVSHLRRGYERRRAVSRQAGSTHELALHLPHDAASSEAHNIGMFERYTEKARRTIFFARYEASQFGSPYIEIEFLLLGLLREDPTLWMRFLRSRTTAEALHKEIKRHRRRDRRSPPLSTSHSPTRASTLSPMPRRKQNVWATDTSAPSTCCSGYSARSSPLQHSCCSGTALTFRLFARTSRRTSRRVLS